jgi:hypothetical protein
MDEKSGSRVSAVARMPSSPARVARAWGASSQVVSMRGGGVDVDYPQSFGPDGAEQVRRVGGRYGDVTGGRPDGPSSEREASAPLEDDEGLRGYGWSAGPVPVHHACR